MSRFLVRLAFSAGICVSFAGAVPAAEQETAARPLPSAAQAKILAALDQPTDFDFRERPLDDVINYFKHKHEIEILLEAKALTSAGVSTDTPITQTLNNITLRSALRLLLSPLALTYVAGDGYLVITSKTEAENKLSCKIYPVHDLVTLDSDFRPLRPKSGDREDSPVQSEVLGGGFAGMGGMGMGGMGMGMGGMGGGFARDEAGDFQSLIDLITSTVEPTSWDEVGGPGSIALNRNSQSIAVSQTDEIHAEIVVLLAALRRVRDQQIAAALRVAPPSPPEPPQVSETIKPLKVRAYRLMRGTTNPGKSGWRPPMQVVGDIRPSRGTQASDKKEDVKEVPDKAESEKDAKAAKDGGAGDQRSPAKPRDEKLEALAEKIVKLVPEMIEPGTWEPSGEGMIRAVGEGVVVRHTEEVQLRVARLMAELLPDCVPMGFNGAWGPWRPALQGDFASMRLRLAATANWPHESEPRASGEEVRIHEALLEKCDLNFDETPLIDALSRLAERLPVQFYIDHKALTAAGVAADAPVTFSIKGLNYRTALKVLLDELNLTWLIRDGLLFITTKTEAENMLTIKVYPIFDLVARPPDAPIRRPNLDFQSLIDAMTTNIAPTSWDEVGGPGAIQPFPNSAALVIAQTTQVHEEIAEYLRALREAGAAQKHEAADAGP